MLCLKFRKILGRFLALKKYVLINYIVILYMLTYSVYLNGMLKMIIDMF